MQMPEPSRRRRTSRCAAIAAFALLAALLTGCDTTAVVLSGTVTAAPSGHGVGGVAISVYADDSETLVDQTNTNLLGDYTLHTSSVADGAYRVRVGERWWPDASSWAAADTVELSASSSTTIDVALDEIGSLSGRVVNDRGDQLADVVVAAVRVADVQIVAVDLTDAAGDFSMPVVTPGTHRVVLVDPAETWPQMSVGGTTPTQLVVVGGEVPVGTIDISTGLPYTAGGTTQRVSVASDGTQADDSTYESSISGNGRYVVFISTARNLVAEEVAGQDVYVHDRSTGETTLVSVASDGTPANSWSENRPAISADGRYVAFLSWASNLVAGDTNEREDVFVHDRSTGTTSRISAAPYGEPCDWCQPDFQLSISADGRYVAFTSYASNLVTGDTNGREDVFVHDRSTGTTSRVSVASDAGQADGHSREAVISANGRYVAFSSLASNLVIGDTNGRSDMFVHDRMTGTTSQVAVGPHASQDTGASPWYRPSISEDGRLVAFDSDRSNLVPGDSNGAPDVFVHDRTTGTTTLASIGNDGTQGYAQIPAITGDGRYVTFTGALSPHTGYGGVYVHDRSTGNTSLVSVASDGTPADSGSDAPSISSDGRSIAFLSDAENLVAGDTDGHSDAFVHSRPAS